MMKTQVYAAYLKDNGILKLSSSGGLFTAITNVALKNDDAIASTIYDYETDTNRFKIILSKEERDEARGSKYFQSNPGNIFSEIKKWLIDNPQKKLFFFGTGCQSYAFLKYAEINKIRDRVIIVDIICHGVPSPKLWKEYINSLKRIYRGSLNNFTFKDKKNGWKYPSSIAKIGDKDVSIQPFRTVYSRESIIRPSCYECRFCSVDRNTDITIGDFWYIDERLPDFFNPDGNSVVLIHTELGKEIFDMCKEEIYYIESSLEKCAQPNLLQPTERPKHRNLFWKDYYKYGIEHVMKKYGIKSIKNRIMIKTEHLIFNVFKGLMG